MLAPPALDPVTGVAGRRSRRRNLRRERSGSRVGGGRARWMWWMGRKRPKYYRGSESLLTCYFTLADAARGVIYLPLYNKRVDVIVHW